MDFNATIDLIIRDLEEAGEIIDDLKKYPGVPVLQVELAKSKCKSAGGVIALLKTINESESPKPEARIAFGKPSATEGSPKPGPEIPKPRIEKDEPDKKVKKPSESAIIADTFIHLPGSLNEQMGSHNADGDISQRLKTKPISSLKEAIGINDRFLFIREIFNNNKDAYAQAISRLEHAESLCDASAIIMSYTGDGNENEAVKQLLDVVKRKFPSDE